MDNISGKLLTKPVADALAARQALARRGTMWVLREMGRTAKAAARSKAPVWKGPGATTFAQMNRGMRFRRAGGIGPFPGQQAQYGGKRSTIYGGPVSGLLRGSISPAKRMKETPSGFTLKVGPRGMRVHLYARKQEDRAHYMTYGQAAAEAQMMTIATKAYSRIWRP